MVDSCKHRILLLGALGVAAGCVREPLTAECLERDALVVTEMRYGVSGDSFSEWVELYNAGDEPLALNGVTIEVESIKDFRVETRSLVIVDDEPLTLEPGEYAAVGEWSSASKKFLVSHYNRKHSVVKVRYDAHGNRYEEVEEVAHKKVVNGDGSEASELFPKPDEANGEELAPLAGTVRLRTCGETVHRRDFVLPILGTLALDGALDPGATTDEPADELGAAWCVDLRLSTDASELGIRGTPGAANPTCAQLADENPTDPGASG